MPTLDATFSELAAHLPELLRLRNGTLPPEEATPFLASLGVADERGLTKKGECVLGHLLGLATVLDVPYA